MPNYNPPKENFFRTDRPESCTAKMTLRLPPSQYEKIKKIEGWQEKVRQQLEKLIEIEESKSA